jgi:hypothetical protein
MYPKREVYFVAVLLLFVSCLTMLQPLPTKPSVGGPALTLADGTHPPPPTPKFEGAQELRADGTHPPPPPWLASVASVA